MPQICKLDDELILSCSAKYLLTNVRLLLENDFHRFYLYISIETGDRFQSVKFEK